jgi:hypothetical protein
MCNFVPGECLGIAPIGIIQDRLADWSFPGTPKVIPVPFPDPEMDDDIFRDYEIIHVTNIPEGMEVLVVSKLSAMFADEIGNHRAVVEFNDYLPLASIPTYQPEPAFTPPAERLIRRLRMAAEAMPSYINATRDKVGFLDSGLNAGTIRSSRPLSAYDYSLGRTKCLFVRPSTPADTADETAAVADHDGLGHGTSVYRILDAILPDDVQIVSGKVAVRDSGVTVLQVARAYAHLVTTERPTVVNLSLAPRDDTLICPRSREVVRIPAFHTQLLPLVFRLAAGVSLPVMAAGNLGQRSIARLALIGTAPPIIAVATDSAGDRASYSNYVDSPANSYLTAFGGDPVDQENGYGIFAGDRASCGTSFAAPFVSAATFILARERLNVSTFLADRGFWWDDPDFCNACRYLLGDWEPLREDPEKAHAADVVVPDIINTADEVMIAGIRLRKRGE